MNLEHERLLQHTLRAADQILDYCEEQGATPAVVVPPLACAIARAIVKIAGGDEEMMQALFREARAMLDKLEVAAVGARPLLN